MPSTYIKTTTGLGHAQKIITILYCCTIRNYHEDNWAAQKGTLFLQVIKTLLRKKEKEKEKNIMFTMVNRLYSKQLQTNQREQFTECRK